MASRPRAACSEYLAHCILSSLSENSLLIANELMTRWSIANWCGLVTLWRFRWKQFKISTEHPENWAVVTIWNLVQEKSAFRESWLGLKASFVHLTWRCQVQSLEKWYGKRQSYLSWNKCQMIWYIQDYRARMSMVLTSCQDFYALYRPLKVYPHAWIPKFHWHYYSLFYFSDPIVARSEHPDSHMSVWPSYNVQTYLTWSRVITNLS